MYRKIVGIFVCMLLIATAVLPAVGIMNEKKTINNESMALLNPTVEWLKTYPGDGFDQFRSVKQTPDGGYIAYGEYSESEMTYARVLKVDADGEEEWTVINHDINGSGYDQQEVMNTIILTSDGGYLAGGSSMYHYVGDGFDFWDTTGFLWKLDSSGNTQWFSQQLYSVEEITRVVPACTIELEDGYINAGWAIMITDINSGEYVLETALFKTDLSGNLEWYKTYNAGGNINNYGVSLSCTTDGGYFISGASGLNLGSVDRIFVVKTDENGNKQWDNIFDGPAFDTCTIRGCCQADDGGYMIAGTTSSYGAGAWDIWVIKIDSSGNMEWDKTLGGTKQDHSWSMIQTDDGRFIINIVYNYGYFAFTRDDILLVNIDQDGKVYWKALIEEDGRQIPIDVDLTDDGGFIIAGRTGDGGSVNTDSFMIKLSSFDNNRPDKPEIDGPDKGKPDTEYTFTATGTDPDGDTLKYMWDWGDGNFSEWLDTNEATYTWTTEDKFDIKVMTMDENGGESDWSDPLSFSTPKNKQYINMPFLKYLEQHPYLFPILRQLLGL